MARKQVEIVVGVEPRRIAHWLGGMLLIAIAALFAMGPMLDAQFVSLDDPATISQNPLLRPPTVSSLVRFWSAPQHDLYAPVTYTFWAALAAISRAMNGELLDPAVFHAANLAIHIFASILVAAIVRMLLRADFPALVAGLFFALHPMQVETVAWASGTKDLLASAFGFAALLAYLLALRGNPLRTRRIPFLVASVFLLLAILSKASAVTIPAIAVALDRAMTRRPFRAIAKTLWPWFALSIAGIIVGALAQPALRARSSPLWLRPLLAGDALTFYIAKIAVPINLAVCYGRTVPDLMAGHWLYFAWLIPAAIAAVLWWRRRTATCALAAACVFTLALGPVMGLVRFDYQYFSTVADHYVYPAMLGAALFVAAILRRFSHPAINVLFTIGLIALAMQTHRQAAVWHDDGSLFSHSVAVAPRGVLALQNLGNVYENRGEHDRAIELYKAALAIQPHHFESMGALAGSLAHGGDQEQAIAWFKKFVDEEGALPPKLRPAAYADHLFTFAETLFHRGDDADAIRYFQLRLALEPNDSIAQRDLQRAEARLSSATKE